MLMTRTASGNGRGRKEGGVGRREGSGGLDHELM